MPPKVRFTKEQILDTAFNIAKEKGLDGISARVLANELGSSVAPIYVNFKNTDELLGAVMQRIGQIVWKYNTKPYTKHGFFNIGIGQLLIARDYPVIFKDLLLKSPNQIKMDNQDWSKMLDIMEEDPMLKGLNREQCHRVLEKMSLQTSGLAIRLASDSEGIKIEEAINIIEETAHQLVFAELNNFRCIGEVKIDKSLIS